MPYIEPKESYNRCIGLDKFWAVFIIGLIELVLPVGKRINIATSSQLDKCNIEHKRYVY